MVQRQWLLAVPVLLILGVGGRALMDPVESRGADRRIVDDKFLKLEAKVGHHLYAPTWLPRGGKVGTIGAMQGARRVLQDFTDNEERSLCILSQEPRNADRDRYHARIFKERAEAQGDIEGKTGYFVTGSSGERRLFWNQPDMAVIISSCVLNDEELLQVARRVQ